MKKLIILSILAIASVTSIMAQDKSSDLKRLMNAMQVDKMVENMMQGMQISMKQQAQTQIQGEAANEKIEAYMNAVMEETTAMTKKLINEEMPSIYDKFFTHDEIKDLVQFYESPTGKKVLEKTPELTQEVVDIMLKKYMPEFREKMSHKMHDCDH